MPKIKSKNFSKKNSSLKKNLIIALAVLAVISAIYLIAEKSGFINSFKLALQIQKQQTAQEQDKVILEQLKKIIELPADVEPTMGVIDDVDKLREQDENFFGNAKNGDRLIMYPNFSIVYDAEANKIMNIGSFVMPGQQVPVVVWDGANDQAATDEFAKFISSTFNNAVVAETGKAKNQDYQGILVIDLTGKLTDVQQVAEKIGGRVAELPAGETAPANAALLFIIGKK